jgi:hypothetical protein
MPPVADPVSWLMIKPGWDVFAVDGTKFGEVDLVAGDDTTDIFDGLAVATSALGEPRYVAAERVARIEDGSIHLSLTSEQLERLDVYLEPATSATIEPNGKGGFGETLAADVRELEGKVFAPTQQHEHPMNFWRRLAFWFRRRAS